VDDNNIWTSLIQFKHIQCKLWFSTSSKTTF